jgi:hypothetical protein
MTEKTVMAFLIVGTTKNICECVWRTFMKNIFFGIGKSRITDEEWETLCKGYKEITGEEYQI